MLTPCLHTAVCQIKFNYIFMATVARALQLALCRPWNAPLTPQQQQQQHTAATVVLLVIQSVFVFVFFFILFYFQLFFFVFAFLRFPRSIGSISLIRPFGATLCIANHKYFLYLINMAALSWWICKMLESISHIYSTVDI